jgi:hypothetical protein
MRIKRIEKFTRSVTKGLLSTQQAVISQIVCGMIICRSLCLAEIARCFQTQTAFPHNLKRAWRFVSNERIQQQASKEVLLAGSSVSFTIGYNSSLTSLLRSSLTGPAFIPFKS